ncbi:hypothetical protein [Zunongwangia sp. HRR-M8]|uniref:hypothetical protein n=1 Tax=Zunongwangia sp. HRR-M8 TaxID=3015170 RepID=UPI0022DD16B0|nr:hypothetical protein [Zunongwangia sp. HRR-M8]WBL22972.1 hypothetical protein PBT89_03200 [Zunongwangia sp. HRR-M8]
MQKVKSLGLRKRLKQLKEKYDFNNLDLQILKKVQNYQIKSICCTTDGGFDKNTGEFYTEERTLNFKIKIVYQRTPNSTLETVLLKAEEADHEHLFRFPEDDIKLNKAV